MTAGILAYNRCGDAITSGAIDRGPNSFKSPTRGRWFSTEFRAGIVRVLLITGGSGASLVRRWSLRRPDRRVRSLSSIRFC